MMDVEVAVGNEISTSSCHVTVSLNVTYSAGDTTLALEALNDAYAEARRRIE